MSDREKMADIEALAKMAARIAGRDPNEHLKIVLAEVVAFDDIIWRYPNFISRAEAAYAILACNPLAYTGQSAETRLSALAGLEYERGL